MRSRAESSALRHLIGTWEFEPVVERQPTGRGRATFEWIEDGAFVLERTEAEWSDPGWVANAPGVDPVRHRLRRHDGRDRDAVRRCARRVQDLPRDPGDDAWRLERAAPGFHQRFIGDFRDEGRTMEGRWESSSDGTAWELDFPITYRKTADR